MEFGGNWREQVWAKLNDPNWHFGDLKTEINNIMYEMYDGHRPIIGDAIPLFAFIEECNEDAYEEYVFSYILLEKMLLN